MSTLENYKEQLARTLPYFRGKELLTVQALSYFKPIPTPDETLISANSLKETITVDPITNLVEVKGVCALVDGSPLPRYTKPYRIVNTTDASKGVLKKLFNKDIAKFSAYNITDHKQVEIPFITSIKAEYIDSIIEMSLTPVIHSAIYDVSKSETDKGLYQSRGASVALSSRYQNELTYDTVNKISQSFSLLHGESNTLLLSTGNLPATNNLKVAKADLSLYLFQYRYVFIHKVDSLPILLDGIVSKAFYTTSSENKLDQDMTTVAVDVNGKLSLVTPRNHPSDFDLTDEDYTYLHVRYNNGNPYTRLLQMVKYDSNIKPTFIQFASRLQNSSPLAPYVDGETFGKVDIDDAKYQLLNGREIPVRFGISAYGENLDECGGVNDVLIKLAGTNEYISYRNHLKTLSGAEDRFNDLSLTQPVYVLLGVRPSDDSPLGNGDYESRLMSVCRLTKEKLPITPRTDNLKAYRRRDGNQWVFVIRDTRMFNQVGEVDGASRKSYHFFFTKLPTESDLKHDTPSEKVGIQLANQQEGSGVRFGFDGLRSAINYQLYKANSRQFEDGTIDVNYGNVSEIGISYNEIKSVSDLPEELRSLPEWQDYDSDAQMIGIIVTVNNPNYKGKLSENFGATHTTFNVVNHANDPVETKRQVWASIPKTRYALYGIEVVEVPDYQSVSVDNKGNKTTNQLKAIFEHEQVSVNNNYQLTARNEETLLSGALNEKGGLFRVIKPILKGSGASSLANEYNNQVANKFHGMSNSPADASTVNRTWVGIVTLPSEARVGGKTNIPAPSKTGHVTIAYIYVPLAEIKNHEVEGSNREYKYYRWPIAWWDGSAWQYCSGQNFISGVENARANADTFAPEFGFLSGASGKKNFVQVSAKTEMINATRENTSKPKFIQLVIKGLDDTEFKVLENHGLTNYRTENGATAALVIRQYKIEMKGGELNINKTFWMDYNDSPYQGHDLGAVDVDYIHQDPSKDWGTYQIAKMDIAEEHLNTSWMNSTHNPPVYANGTMHLKYHGKEGTKHNFELLICNGDYTQSSGRFTGQGYNVGIASAMHFWQDPNGANSNNIASIATLRETDYVEFGTAQERGSVARWESMTADNADKVIVRKIENNLRRKNDDGRDNRNVIKPLEMMENNNSGFSSFTNYGCYTKIFFSVEESLLRGNGEQKLYNTYLGNMPVLYLYGEPVHKDKTYSRILEVIYLHDLELLKAKYTGVRTGYSLPYGRM